MQAERNGQYLYIYSGREFTTMNPDMTQVGQEDPFATVKILRIKSITSIEVNHKECTILIYVVGRQSPIYCRFGDRNCYKINCFTAFLQVLSEALCLHSELLWNLKRRNSQTALSVQRADEINDEESE